MTAASLVSLSLALLWGGFALAWLLRRKAARRAALPALLGAGLLLAPYVVSKPGGTNGPPVRGSAPARTIPASDLPAWFLAIGYDSADADASGIPDCWERWTHTSGMAASADPDGDGQTNLDEFLAQTDPIRADTDGDGLSDADELAGLSSGTPDLDPLVPATFLADEPDTDENGVPDLWDGSLLPEFLGTDAQGFPLYLDIPEPAVSNYDVRLTVTSSRHAALDWGDGTLLLPVCTNLVLRLRLGSDAVKSVTLSPAPSAASSPGGAWKASVRAEWDPRRGLPTEGNSVALDDGTMVDRSVSESRFVGVLPPPSRTSLPWGLIRPDMIFVPKALRFSPDPALRFLCANHDANPQVDVAARNLGQEDLAWLENGVPVGTGGTNHVLQTSLAPGETRTVVCTVHEPYENLRLQAACQIEGKQCRPGRTNLVGAAWTSTHDPFSPIDHAPGIETADVVFGPHCPMAHDMTVRVGWTHDSTVLHARNLPVVPSGDAEYDSVDHCIGLPWTAGGEIDLLSYLAPECRPFLDRLSFSLNGVLCPDWVPCGPKPDSLYPRAFLVSVWSSGSGRPLDTMVLTIYSPNDATEFATWYTRNLSSWQWTLDLPPPPPHLPSGATEAWHAPETPGRFMHHDAVYELRSKPINGGHGHQATYDGNGQLITSTIAAGTADFAAPESVIEGTVQMHRNEDVYPYIRALHLDGNPGLPDNGAGWMTKTIPCRLSLPCIYQGRNVNDYISLRPTLPTGIQTP